MIQMSRTGAHTVRANTRSLPARRPLARALRSALPAAMLLSAGLLAAPTAAATSFQVGNLADSGPGSLRHAISQANSNPGADVITFAASVSGTIQLTSGALAISDDLQIDGPGAGVVTVSGAGVAAPPPAVNAAREAPGVFTIDAPGQGQQPQGQQTKGSGNAPQAVTTSIVSLSGLTITGGSARYGGGVYAYNADLTISNCIITDNHAEFIGGGVFVGGPAASLTLQSSTVSGNTSGAIGGGVAILGKYAAGIDVASSSNVVDAVMAANGGATSSLTITDSVITGNSVNAPGESNIFGGGVLSVVHSASISRSTISNNSVTGDQASGGGVMAVATPSYDSNMPGDIHIVDTTISGNQAVSTGTDGNVYATGGGLMLLGNIRISNSTISGNSADKSGGGIGIQSKYGSTTIIDHSTIVDNQAGAYGGGIVAGNDGDVSVPLTIRNSVIGNNGAATDPSLHIRTTNGDPGGGTLPVALSYSLVEAPGAAAISDNGGNILNQDPMLGPLSDNGGPTLTRLPLADSPLINAGNPAFSGPPATDQRGTPYARIVDGTVDIGAVEFGAGPAAPVANSIPVPGLGIWGKLGLGMLLGWVALAWNRRRQRPHALRRL